MPRALFGVPSLLFVMSLWLALGSLGCSDETSAQCRAACERADECADSVKDPNYKFDKGECTAACAFLEKDAKGQKLVASYAECIKGASSCEQVNTCE